MAGVSQAGSRIPDLVGREPKDERRIESRREQSGGAGCGDAADASRAIRKRGRDCTTQKEHCGFTEGLLDRAAKAGRDNRGK